MKTHRSLALLLGAVAIAAVGCGEQTAQVITGPTSGAYIKFFNFSVGAPGVYFYANDQKVTAVSSTKCQPPADTTAMCTSTGNDSTAGTGFGAAGAGGLYSQIAPGDYSLTGKAAVIATASTPHPTISTVSTKLEDGKYYSYFQSGLYNTTSKTAEAFVVEDQLPAIDYSKVYIRFVNAIPNSSPIQLFATVAGTDYPISNPAAYKNAGAFIGIAIPTGSNGFAADLTAKAGAGQPTLFNRVGVTFIAGHAYTVTARGDITSSSATNKPFLDNTANR